MSLCSAEGLLDHVLSAPVDAVPVCPSGQVETFMSTLEKQLCSSQPTEVTLHTGGT